MCCFLILAGCDSSFSPRWEGAELEARFLVLGEVSEGNAVLGVLSVQHHPTSSCRCGLVAADLNKRGVVRSPEIGSVDLAGESRFPSPRQSALKNMD